MVVFGNRGFVNAVAMGLGLIREPLQIMYTEFAVVVADGFEERLHAVLHREVVECGEVVLVEVLVVLVQVDVDGGAGCEAG